MICKECGYEFKENDEYFDVGWWVLCEYCIDDYMDDLKNFEFKRNYKPNEENDDFMLDLERDK